tara:strand:- start:292 stop:957 length:666 start_codon:yes stop_codon:yes gene_type:complete
MNNNFDWSNYNLKRNKEAIKINNYNLRQNVNFLEKGVYKNVRDIYALSIIVSQIGKKKINILDFGGNLMPHVNLSNKINIRNINIYIFNPFSKNNKLKKKNLKIVTLKKYEQLQKIKFDLIYFGSVLQYIENLIILKKKIINNSKFVLITHTPIIFNKKNFKEVQKNESKLIQKIHSFDELKKNIFNKFNLIFKSVNDFKFTGLRKNKKNTYSLNLLFKKK